MDDVSCSHSCTWPDCAAEIARLTEQCAVLEASNRIRGDELARLRAVEPVAWMDDFGNAFPLAANKGAGSWMDEHKRHWKPLYLAAPPAQPARCTICNGDDMQAPCAYPGEGIFGCVRDKRLKAAQPAPAQEPAQRLSDADFDMQIAGLAMIEATMTIDGKPTLGMAGAEQAWSMVEAAICPPGYVVVRDDFDATECIAAGNKLYRYAQGTGPCVAFYRGAQWLAAAQKAQP